MSDKGEEAFRTISEVAEELDLPQHVLRFWESRFAQIRPLKRGGGRRYYRPDDVELLRGIRYLLYVKGFTIKGVQRILKENGSRFVVAIGSGDLAGLDSLQSSEPGGAASAEEPERHVDDLDLIQPDPETVAEVSEPVAAPEAMRPRGGGFSGFLRRDRDAEGLKLPKSSLETLDAVLLDLLECKRLLDQVR